MARGKSPAQVIEEAERILRVWEANPNFSLGEITKEKMQTMVSELKQTCASLENLRRQVIETSNLVDDEIEGLNSVNVRARAGVKAVYGPNSSQYEEVGGTRESERKPARPKKNKPSS